MQDRELRQILLNTCPVRLGQEDRAWGALRDRLYAPKALGWSFTHFAIWRGLLVAAPLFVGVAVITEVVISRAQPISIATAESEAPGIYATSFYSNSAKAQVIWLNGLDPATDKPTYLDATTRISGPKQDPSSANPPNSF